MKNKTVFKGEKQNMKYLSQDQLLGGESPLPIKEVDAIKAPCFENLKYIISFFNQDEQKLIVSAYENNKNTSYCLDFATINGKLTETLKKKLKETSENLSFRSVDTRKALGCLIRGPKRVDPNDTSINSDLNPISREQGLANKATALFAKQATKILVRRWRFLTFTIAQQQLLGVKDSNGDFEGFVYTMDEIEEFVRSFRNYAYEQYSYRVSLLDVVTKSVRHVAQIFNDFGCDKKKENEAKKNSTDRNETKKNETKKNETKKNEKEENEANKNATGKNQTERNETRNESKKQSDNYDDDVKKEKNSKSNSNESGKNSTNGSSESGNNNTNSSSSGSSSNSNSGTNSNSNSGSGSNSNSGSGTGSNTNNSKNPNNNSSTPSENDDCDDTPDKRNLEEISVTIPTISPVASLSSTISSDFRMYLSPTALTKSLEFAKTVINLSEQGANELFKTHRPATDLYKDLVEEFVEDKQLFDFFQHTRSCKTGDVHYLITANLKLTCKGNCFNNVTSLNLRVDSGSILPQDFQINFGCSNESQAYAFAKMEDSSFGNKVSLVTPDVDLGSEMRAHQKRCSFLIFNTEANMESQKKECKIFIESSTCSQQIMESCTKSGLKDIVEKTKITNPIPFVCDNLKQGYKVLDCMNWLNARIVRNTLILRINQLDNLPEYIANEGSRIRLRFLEDASATTSTSVKLATEEQSKQLANLPAFSDSAFAELSVSVEGSTPEKAANTDLATIDEAAKEEENKPSSYGFVLTYFFSFFFLASMLLF